MILQLSVDSHSVISGIDSTFTFLRQRDIDFYILTDDASRAPLELASAYLEAGPNTCVTRSGVAPSHLSVRMPPPTTSGPLA